MTKQNQPATPSRVRASWSPRWLVAALVCVESVATDSERLNGFALEPASIAISEIHRGGPPRDGIPALVSPKSIAADDAPWKDDDWVIGVVQRGEARAYPIPLLTWHELVNDSLGGRPILVSYCPLCGSALVFDRRPGEGTDARVLEFGVSGLLYRSDLLMYDRDSDSLWSQIGANAVTGPRLGQRLTVIRSSMLPWGRWRELHPDTTVLGINTGYRRRYGSTPYRGYERSSELMAPAPLDRRYHPKHRTLGLRTARGEARAYPSQELERAGGCVEERFAGGQVRVQWDRRARTFSFEIPDEGVEVIEGYWFAWAAFHPATEVFLASGAPADARCGRG